MCWETAKGTQHRSKSRVYVLSIYFQQRCDLIDSVAEQDVYDAAEEVGHAYKNSHSPTRFLFRSQLQNLCNLVSLTY